MIYIGTNCDKCKHSRDNIDGWLPACDAFPEGIPANFYGNDEGEICNGKIGYEPDPNLVKIFE